MWFTVTQIEEPKPWKMQLTQWGWETHICVTKLTIMGPDNGFLPDWCQAIIWTNAGILLIGPLGTNFSEISIKIHTVFFFSRKCIWKVVWNMAAIFLGLNVLKWTPLMLMWIWHLTVSCKYAKIFPNRATINWLVAASRWYWPRSGTLWHVYRVQLQYRDIPSSL